MTFYAYFGLHSFYLSICFAWYLNHLHKDKESVKRNQPVDNIVTALIDITHRFYFRVSNFDSNVAVSCYILKIPSTVTIGLLQ